MVNLIYPRAEAGGDSTFIKRNAD